jgi:shikimate dehydrogenase
MKKKRAVAKEVYTLADLQAWRDVDPPIRVGVFGDPVEHSLSPQMQNAALQHCKIDGQYARFHISPQELPESIELIRKLEFVGVNLTIPHKIAALGLVDIADENAKRIGAINVIKVEGGKLRGFNTDGRGFARAIREEFSVDLRDMRVMLLGAGGGARAIALQCAKENCKC